MRLLHHNIFLVQQYFLFKFCRFLRVQFTWCLVFTTRTLRFDFDRCKVIVRYTVIMVCITGTSVASESTSHPGSRTQCLRSVCSQTSGQQSVTLDFTCTLANGIGHYLIKFVNCIVLYQPEALYILQSDQQHCGFFVCQSIEKCIVLLANSIYYAVFSPINRLQLRYSVILLVSFVVKLQQPMKLLVVV